MRLQHRTGKDRRHLEVRDSLKLLCWQSQLTLWDQSRFNSGSWLGLTEAEGHLQPMPRAARGGAFSAALGKSMERHFCAQSQPHTPFDLGAAGRCPGDKEKFFTLVSLDFQRLIKTSDLFNVYRFSQAFCLLVDCFLGFWFRTLRFLLYVSLRNLLFNLNFYFLCIS